MRSECRCLFLPLLSLAAFLPDPTFLLPYLRTQRRQQQRKKERTKTSYQKEHLRIHEQKKQKKYLPAKCTELAQDAVLLVTERRLAQVAVLYVNALLPPPSCFLFRYFALP